jgi:hypothetical protein
LGDHQCQFAGKIKTSFMTYQLNGNCLLFAISRAEILDISTGDLITLDGFTATGYTWKEQDSEFVENNPDDDIFLEMERQEDKTFKATRIVLKESSPAMA